MLAWLDLSAGTLLAATWSGATGVEVAMPWWGVCQVRSECRASCGGEPWGRCCDVGMSGRLRMGQPVPNMSVLGEGGLGRDRLTWVRWRSHGRPGWMTAVAIQFCMLGGRAGRAIHDGHKCAQVWTARVGRRRWLSCNGLVLRPERARGTPLGAGVSMTRRPTAGFF